MSARIPILRIGSFLLATIQVELDDELAMTLQEDLTQAISDHGAKGVLIDISSMEMIDSFIGRVLGNVAACSRILDAATVVVGMRPAVAITLVEMGVQLSGIRTALNVDRALQDGFTTGGGMGMGLAGAGRLVNDFEIVSAAGEGTRITITRWLS